MRVGGEEGVLIRPSEPLVFMAQSGETLATWDGILEGGARAAPGVYVARVQNVDDLGMVEESEVSFVVAWEDAFSSPQVSLVPNPAPGGGGAIREIRLAAAGGFRGTIRIYSLAGELLWNRPVASAGPLAVPVEAHWEAGVYLVLVSGADDEGRPVRVLEKWVIL